MILRKATMADLDGICELYTKVCDKMVSEGNHQWHFGDYPSRELLQSDIEKGNLYCCVYGPAGMAVAVTIDLEQETGYMEVNWLFGARPGIFHRMAVNPDCQRQGIGSQALEDVQEIMRRMGCDSLRCDTYCDNTGALRFYALRGLREAGKVRLKNRPKNFVCFEKRLIEDCPLLPVKMHPAQRGGALTPWGGTRLFRLFSKDVQDMPAGESLEVSALPGLESKDDMGVALPFLVKAYGWKFAGKYAQKPFPLLLKLIDAKKSLSVQVHPNDAYAAENEHGKLGKTEAWLVLDAPREGGILVYGIQPGVTKEQLQAACEQGGEALDPMLRKVTVHTGDVCYIPAGCAHAIAAGTMVYEVQQSSDLTYRLYDWGRVNDRGEARELHIQKAIDVIDLSLNIDPIPAPNLPYARVLDVDHFALDLYRVSGEEPVRPFGDFGMLTILDGTIDLSWGSAAISMKKGDTVYLPTSAPHLKMTGRAHVAVSMPK